ncbi:MAG: diguanylate cyclase [Hyphomicrobiales bacterium]|nr:diguanylate cyclase [Hyphomicrobiales bacterium]
MGIIENWSRNLGNLAGLRTRASGAAAATRENPFSSLGENTSEGVLVADCRLDDMPIIYVNAAFEAITGYKSADIVGKNCRYLQGDERLQPQVEQMRAAIASGASAKVTLRNYKKDGTAFWNELRLMPIRGNGGDVTHFVGFMRDVTARQCVAKSPGNAHLDRLTSSLNASSFVDALGKINAVHPVLVVNVDVAQFKDVNSGYGFDIGDALLVQIAQRMTMLGADIAARLEGDKFAIAFTAGTGVDVRDQLAYVVEVLEERYTLPGASIRPRFAIGYVTGEVGSNPVALVRNAATALEQSKSTRLRESRGFDVHGARSADERLRLTNELQEAVANGDFLYHFQPQVLLEGGEVIGAEALLRWSHGVLGLQEPQRFVSHAENTGIILDIGRRGLRSIAEFARRVNAGKTRPLQFAFNVSDVEFTRRDFVSYVEGVLSASRVDPSWLKLELSERMMTDESDEMLMTFRHLRDLGIGIAIDNFGAGYSTLRLLEAFPVSEIKIDRSLVRELTASATKRIVVDGLIKIAAELKFDLVAEGIETEAERRLLMEMGCTRGQGFLFSPPVGVDTFVQLASRTGAEATMQEGAPRLLHHLETGVLRHAQS